MAGPANQLLDVALGLALMFLVLSLVCSLVQELLATGLAWRAKFLRRGLRSMLDRDPVGGGGLSDVVLGSPFIEEKLNPHRRLWRSLNVPPYLPSATFARAVVERLGWPLQLSDDVPPGVRRKLTSMAEEAAGDVTRFRADLVEWYDATMTRVSAWYKRRARVVLFFVGVLVAGMTNADLIDVTGRLWRDDAVRAAVVAQAQRVAAEQDVAGVEEDLRASLESTGDLLETVKQFELPLGWNAANGQLSDMAFHRTRPEQESWSNWLLGVLLTAAALSFGAPFWFNVLSRLARFRSERTAVARE